MKIALLVLFAVCGTAFLVAADKQKKDPSAAELLAKISVLEERLARAESRLAALEQKAVISFVPAESLPAPIQNTLEEPPHTGALEFNGLKFFWVPLADSSAAKPTFSR